MKVRGYCDDMHFNNIQYYCEDLGRAICKDDAQKYINEGHILKPIKDVAALDLYDVRITASKGKTLLEEIMKFIHRAKMRYDEMKESVNAAFDKYITQLLTLKDKTLSEIEREGPNTFSTNFHELNNLYTNLRVIVESTEQLANELDNLIQGTQHQLTIKKLQEVDIRSNSEQVDRIRKLFEANSLMSQGIEPFKVIPVDTSPSTLFSHIGLTRVITPATIPPSINSLPQTLLPKDLNPIKSPPYNPPYTGPPSYTPPYIPPKPLIDSIPKSGLNFYSGPSSSADQSQNRDIRNASGYQPPFNQPPTPQIPPVTQNLIPQPIFTQSPQISMPLVHSFYNGKLYLYDLATQQISTVDTPLLSEFPQNCFPSIFIKDGIFICGGYKNNNAIPFCFIFDLIKSQMLRPNDMMQKRYYHSIALVGRKTVYAIGGHDNINTIRSCEKYDIDLDKWEVVPNLSNDRSCTTSFCFQERFLYSLGGWSDMLKSYLNTIEKLDSTNENAGWSLISINDSSWIPKYGCNSCQISNSQFIIFGGVNTKTEFAECYLYDGFNESMVLKSKMRNPNYFYNQCSQPILYKGIVYSVDNNMSLQFYDTKTNEWNILRWNQWNPVANA